MLPMVKGFVYYTKHGRFHILCLIRSMTFVYIFTYAGGLLLQFSEGLIKPKQGRVCAS